jgi:hypothetical protein
MVTQQEELYRQLETFGWRKVDGAEPDDQLLDWWADEVWVLESLWEPQECHVYLTFVVDPQWDSHRKKGQGVWGVTASLHGPAQWSDVELNLMRPGRRREGLPEFFAGLAKLRTGWQKTSVKPPSNELWKAAGPGQSRVSLAHPAASPREE